MDQQETTQTVEETTEQKQGWFATHGIEVFIGAILSLWGFYLLGYSKGYRTCITDINFDHIINLITKDSD